MGWEKYIYTTTDWLESEVFESMLEKTFFFGGVVVPNTNISTHNICLH